MDMNQQLQQLQAEIARLTAENQRKEALLEEQTKKLLETTALAKHYEELWSILNRQVYGSSSEQHLGHKKASSNDPNQQSFFDEINIPLLNEAEATVDLEETVRQKQSNPQKKSRQKKEDWMEARVTQVVDASLVADDAQLTCPSCAHQMHEMKRDVRYEVQIIPAKVNVTKYIEPSYACRHCQEHGEETPVLRVSPRIPLLPESSASVESVAWLIEQKYHMGMPLYRLEQHFYKQLNVPLSRQTMSDWLVAASQRYAKPLFERMKKQLIAEPLIHIDETRLQVLKEPNRIASQNSFVWAYCSGRSSPPMVLYDYQMGRHATHPAEFLKGFDGAIQSDGYSAYKQFKKAAACFAHVRRKFAELVKAFPPKEGEVTLSMTGLQLVDAIYHEEHCIAKSLPAPYTEEQLEKIQAAREKELKPHFDRFFNWCSTTQHQSVGNLRKAIDYALKQEKGLRYILSNPHSELDNNRVERDGIKPFVMGRKAWLFSNTPSGADSSMLLYSLVVTAKLNGLNINAYLCHIFNQMKTKEDWHQSFIDSLLPWSKSLPLHVFNYSN